MKHKINKVMMYVSGIFFLTVFGCTELDETPLDFTGPGNFYQDKSQVEAAFTSSMSRIYDRWNDSYGYGAHCCVFNNTDQLHGGDLALSANTANGMWRDHYRAIADLNPAIKALNSEDSPINQDDKDLLMAQARFLRGMNYFYLVRLYGDVPIIDEETDVINDEIARKPITEVYDFIIADMTFAVQNLPDMWGDTPGRPTSGVAKGFLAKIHLTMATFPIGDASNYAKARDWAADVMDDGVYSLVPNVAEVFELSNQYGPEMMFSFNATEDDKSTPPQIWLPSHMADGWGDHRANRVWFAAYPEQPRKEAYLLMEDWDGVRYTDWPNGEGHHIKKYLYDTRENAERLATTQNYVLLRYADILLMYAEAENMVNGGPTQGAVDAVNMIINRANGGAVNPDNPLLTIGMTQEDFDAAVLNERNYELAFEFDRWFDLVRKRTLCDVVNDEYKVNCDPNGYLFPIPQADLRLNPLLTQNPGYPTPGGD
ncbi:MAG: hypothetical protein DHS20C17_18040 [Cyclobacteriaceae bacterium]|nr:MAG: hypothetical protein DHS20C17_18040 [Cyclobacteriaceae bacterium]